MGSSTEGSSRNHLTHITLSAQCLSLQGFIGVTWVVRWVIRVRWTRVYSVGEGERRLHWRVRRSDTGAVARGAMTSAGGRSMVCAGSAGTRRLKGGEKYAGNAGADNV